MFADVAKDAGSVCNLKRQSNSLSDTNRPHIFARLGLLEFPPTRQLAFIDKIGEGTINRRLILYAESLIVSVESW